MDLDTIHHEQVEEDDFNMPMVLHHEARQRRGQRNAKEEEFSPLEKFSGMPIRPKLCYFHAF